jgi:hypothetical protein
MTMNRRDAYPRWHAKSVMRKSSIVGLLAKFSALSPQLGRLPSKPFTCTGHPQ